jgi:hypothetical protein
LRIAAHFAFALREHHDHASPRLEPHLLRSDAQGSFQEIDQGAGGGWHARTI